MVVGDPAYLLRDWCMIGRMCVPLDQPEQESFNVYLSSLRVGVEMAFGKLKSRWRVLLKKKWLSLLCTDDDSYMLCTAQLLWEAKWWGEFKLVKQHLWGWPTLPSAYPTCSCFCQHKWQECKRSTDQVFGPSFSPPSRSPTLKTDTSKKRTLLRICYFLLSKKHYLVTSTYQSK